MIGTKAQTILRFFRVVGFYRKCRYASGPISFTSGFVEIHFVLAAEKATVQLLAVREPTV